MGNAGQTALRYCSAWSPRPYHFAQGSPADVAFECRGDTMELAPSVLEVVADWGKCVTVGTPNGRGAQWDELSGSLI